MLNKVFDVICNFIYPNKCVLCNKEVIKREAHLCEGCLKDLKPKPRLEYLESDENIKGKVKCISPFIYAGSIKSAIWRFKFRGYKNYSKFFAGIIAKEIQKRFQNLRFDYICFVPLRKEREKNRGYNQAKCIAEDISSIIEIPCKDILIKVKSNHVQHELDLIHRRANVKGAYDVKNESEVLNKSILLCDDIVTSGSTLMECSKVLFESGANSVFCCTIAYIPKSDFSDKHQ